LSKSIVRKSRVKALLSTPLAAGMVLAACLAGNASAESPSRVRAVYNINFNGMNVGEFTINANIAEHEYTISADAKISVLAGLVFEWTAKTSSSGRVVNRVPAPSAYSFGYEAGDKHERIDLRFSESGVRDVAVNPPARMASHVPVTRAHLQNVVDPLSAIVLLATHRDKGTEVCNRRLPIFDGKQRYDLVLSYKRTKKVSTDEGYSGPAYVCKVKFLPIAGHKQGDPDNNYAARNEGMEVWMVPVSRTNLYVPYYIQIPTQAGAATLTYVKVDVESRGSGRRAFVE
jgi:hypothetical protein